jgi:hypothetical protein
MTVHTMMMNIKPRFQNSSSIVYCFGEIVLRAGLEQIQGNSHSSIPIYVDKHGKTTLHIINNIQEHMMIKQLSVHLYKIAQNGEAEEVVNEHFPKIYDSNIKHIIEIQDGRHTFPHSGNSKSVLHLKCKVDGEEIELIYFYLFAEPPKKLPRHKNEAEFAKHNANLLQSKNMFERSGTVNITLAIYS